MREARALVALSVLALAGCAGPAAPWGQWTKSGVGVPTQRRDEYECQRQAVLRRETAAETAALFAACMRSRGYQRAAVD